MKLCFKNVAQAGLLSMAFALAACTGSDAIIGGSTGLVISGSLSSSSIMTLNQKISDVSSNDVNAHAVEFSDLEIVATASTEPPTSAEANVNSDGSFTVDLGENAKNTSITIVFRNKETEAVVGEVKFTDSSDTDLNGNPKAESAVIAKDDLALGTINLSDDGTISISKDSVANVEDVAPVAAASAFDPTGEWVISAYDGTIGSGFSNVDPCPADGPCSGMPLTLARFAGKEFTPDTGNCVKDASGTIVSCPVTSGTVGTADRYGLSIWGGDYANSFGACGGTTGFSADEARGYGRIHLTSLPTVSAVVGAINFGPYVFSTAVGFGGDAAPFNEPWMKTGATSNHDEYDCRPTTVSGTQSVYKAWACRAKAYYGMWPGTPVSAGTIAWNIGVQGSGCLGADGKPINVTNWQNIGNVTCNQNSAATYGPGFQSNSCTYSNADHDGVSSTALVSFTCTHIGGQFEDAGGNPSSTPLTLPQGEYLGQPEKIILQGQTCDTAGSATSAAKLAAYRCYASNYWSDGGSFADGTCGRQYNFDWQTTDPLKFVRKDDFKGRPKNAFITNILNYAADGQSATLEDEESESVTIPTGANNSTFCKVVRKTLLTFKKVTATKVLVELREGGRMASTDAACIAAGNAAKTDLNNELNWMLESKNWIFYLNK